MGIHEAMDVCKKKLNNSIMPYQDNQESLKIFTSWYDNITGRFCKIVWTPFTDGDNEGIYLNMNYGTKAKYLQWNRKQPNGGTSQNYVSNSLQTSLYSDSGMNEQFCSSCLLDRSLLLRLDGLCEDSFIGDSIKIFHKYKYIFLNIQIHNFPWSTPGPQSATMDGEKHTSVELLI